jgi:hypothetical protein
MDGSVVVDGALIGQKLIVGAVLTDNSVVKGPGIEVAAIQGALPAGSTTVTASLIAAPVGLPDGFTPVGMAVDLQVDASVLAMPLIIKLRYDDAGIPDESRMFVLHYSNARGWEPVTMLGIDPVENSVVFELAEFSPIQTGWENFSVDGPFVVQHASPIKTGGSTQFSPQADGWPIDNGFVSPDSPAGHCLGMSAYAVWWFRELEAGRASLPMSAAFASTKPWPPQPADPTSSNAPAVSIAHLTAIRADQRLSQYMAYYQYSNYWPAGPDASPSCTGPACKVGNSWCIVDPVTKAQLLCYNPLTPAQRGNLMKKILKKWNRPLVMGLQGPRGGHAVVLYGYDSNYNELYFYDVNDGFGTNGSERSGQSLDFDGTKFGTYGLYSEFGFIAEPSWGGYSSFDEVRSDSEKGFTSSALLTLDHPAPTEGIVTPLTPMVGTTKDASGVLYGYGNDYAADQIFLHIDVKDGVLGTVPQINVDPGKNVLVLIGGAKIPCPSWAPNCGDPNFWHGITLVRTFCASADGSYKWNPQTQQCECPANQKWDDNAKACRPLPDAGTDAAPDAGICSPGMTYDSTAKKCYAAYVGVNTFCTQACTGTTCTAPNCTTAPVIFTVDEEGGVCLPSTKSTALTSTSITCTHEGQKFTIKQVDQVAALQFTTTSIYQGTLTGETIQGTFSGAGSEGGTTTTQTGTFTATHVTPPADSGT